MADQPLMSQALASRARRRIIDDAMQGMGSARGAHISIRGGRFRLVNATGIETPFETHHMDVIIIDANDKPARVFFENPYDPSSDEPPVCWSDNGTGPSTGAMSPQAPSCMQCPRNVRGTKQTFTGKPTTACENRKKFAVIIPGDTAVNVYEFQIPPGSLTNFRNYGQWLGQQASGIEGRALDVADVVTRVAFDPDKQFVMTFQAVEFADDEQTLQLIEYIDANHLSDQAVGRNDVACAPEMVEKMLLGGAGQRALPAAQQADLRPASPQFTPLPPRQTAAQQLQAPPAQTAAPAAPQPRQSRGRPRAQAEPQSAPMNGHVETTAAPTRTAAPDAASDIPAFLRRAPAASEGQTTVQAAPPRFGVGQAPPPPAEISDALGKAMALPTRRA
ncbi:MAG: hypothetical protein KGL35_24800 [Bradyrhizobium sp.]|nr:hypothetical protein [Bradyrhizobium sp.]